MKRVILVFLVGLVLVGCGPKKPDLAEVELPPKPFLHKGFSITAPNESGWLILGRAPYQMALARQGDTPDESHAMQASALRVQKFPSDDAFLKFVKEGQAKDTDIDNLERYKVVSHDASLKVHKDQTCAYTHMITEDHGAMKSINTSNVHMLLDIYALVCRHPDDATVAVSANYSQRYYPNNKSLDIESIAQGVLGSLTFQPLE